MLSGRTTTTVSAPARGPLDYNSIRPTFGQLAPLFGLALLAVLPVALGGLLVYWSWPSEGEASGLRVLGLALGGLLIVAGARFFWPLSTTIPDAVRQWYAMVYAWHDAELTKFEASEGQVIAQQVSEWTYTQFDMRHVALATLWVYLSGEKKLSIERLTRGPLMLPVGHRAFKLMDMSQDGAADFLNLLAAAGIVTGRGPRVAGTVTMMEPRAAITRVLAEAAKNPQAIATPEA